MKTFLFYDIETSGLSSAFDQVLTFAAIRTDTRLEEISRESVTIKLRDDIVPSPWAFLTHRLTPESLQDGLCEYDAAHKIHRIMNRPGTVSIGYNTLGFDDEFLRFTFYRNLLDPYTHQYAGSCSRMDLLPVATLFRVFKPDIVKWPEVDGKPSLKLEHITRENNFATSARAHDAMADVESTLALAKALKAQEEMWTYALGFFDKKTDQARLNQIEKTVSTESETFRVCIMVSVFFGPEKMYMAPVLHIGGSEPYPNQSLWLRLDTDDFLPGVFDPEKNQPPVIRKKTAEANLILPPVERFWTRLSGQQQQQCSANLAALASKPKLFCRIVHHHRSYKYPVIPDLDADAGLYQDGFFSRDEKKAMALFNRAEGKKKVSVLEKTTTSRVKTLGARIVARNFPEFSPLLPENLQNGYREMVKKLGEKNRIRGFKNDFKFSLPEAEQEIIDIEGKNRLDREQEKLMVWLKSRVAAMAKPGK
ncbi:MAG: exonuclease domain-containing protein [Desulfobacteraceae bacterium]